MTAPASQRAQAGAALLDAHLPGWAAWVDLDALDATPAGSVLAQLRGQRVSVSGLCAVLVVNQTAHGFASNSPDSPGHDHSDSEDPDEDNPDTNNDDNAEDSEALAVAWRAEVTRRTVTRIH